MSDEEIMATCKVCGTFIDSCMDFCTDEHEEIYFEEKMKWLEEEVKKTSRPSSR